MQIDPDSGDINLWSKYKVPIEICGRMHIDSKKFIFKLFGIFVSIVAILPCRDFNGLRQRYSQHLKFACRFPSSSFSAHFLRINADCGQAEWIFHIPFMIGWHRKSCLTWRLILISHKNAVFDKVVAINFDAHIIHGMLIFWNL